MSAKYVALSIDCEQQKLIESVDMKALTTLYEGVPLMQFRLATCGRPAAQDGRTPRTRSTMDGHVLLGSANEMVASLGQAIDLSKVIGLYGQGREAFPSSLMLTMAWSNANLMAEEFESASRGLKKC